MLSMPILWLLVVVFVLASCYVCLGNPPSANQHRLLIVDRPRIWTVVKGYDISLTGLNNWINSTLSVLEGRLCQTAFVLPRFFDTPLAWNQLDPRYHSICKITHEGRVRLIVPRVGILGLLINLASCTVLVFHSSIGSTWCRSWYELMWPVLLHSYLSFWVSMNATGSLK